MPVTSPAGPSPANSRSAIDALNAPSSSRAQSGYSALGQGDFLKLLTVQLKLQDPLEPVDNKEMLAQMAQFSALANSTATQATLEEISTKLDQLIQIQTPRTPVSPSVSPQPGTSDPLTPTPTPTTI